MTRRDYVLISNILHSWAGAEDMPQIVEDFCIALKKENERFDAEIFKKNIFGLEHL